MITTAGLGPTSASTESGRASGWSSKALHLSSRLITFAVLAAAGLAALVSTRTIRGWEAQVCAWAIAHITSSAASADASRAVFSWDLFTPRAYGLVITSECTVAVMAGPVLISMAVVATLRRVPPWRALVGALIGVVLLTVVNFVRLLVIAESIHVFGYRVAFWWSHVVVGSILSLAGFLGALALAIRFSFADRRAGDAGRVAPSGRLQIPPTRKATP